MIDPGTGLTVLGGALGSAKLIEKMLGPTAEYLGENIKDWTKKRVENTNSIFKNAEKKLGERIDDKGQVPPKVLKGVLDEGSWSEEELQIEYFGGVLASSRTKTSRDDRGASMISLISRLSTYQLRTHYVIYQCIKNHFNKQNFNIAESKDRRKMEIYIPFSSYKNSMDFNSEEMEEFHSLMVHAIWGLNREELISTFKYGPPNFLNLDVKKHKEHGIIIQPSILGVELFMWAFGFGRNHSIEFLSPKMEFNTTEKIPIHQVYKTK